MLFRSVKDAEEVPEDKLTSYLESLGGKVLKVYKGTVSMFADFTITEETDLPKDFKEKIESILAGSDYEFGNVMLDKHNFSLVMSKRRAVKKEDSKRRPVLSHKKVKSRKADAKSSFKYPAWLRKV